MLQILGNVLHWSLYGSLGLSTLITILNNSCSNSRIKRKGFEIKPITSNSVIENIIYFVKDYGFIAIPFYNLIHSISQTAKKNSEYDSKRMDILTDRDRLVKAEEVKPESTSSTKEKTSRNEKKKEVLPVEVITKKEDKKRKPKKVEETTEQEKSLEEMSCYERREYYRNEYNELLALRNKYKAKGKSVQILNLISHEMQPIVDEYKKADRECRLEDLKSEKNIILSSMGNEPMKLTRK